MNPFGRLLVTPFGRLLVTPFGRRVLGGGTFWGHRGDVGVGAEAGWRDRPRGGRGAGTTAVGNPDREGVYEWLHTP